LFSKKNHILVTGANGFIGRNLSKFLLQKQLNLITVSRHEKSIDGAHKHVLRSVIKSEKDWSSLLKNCSTIIHLSGIAHRNETPTEDFEEQIYNVNVNQTLQLARMAVKNNIKRFIFLSSIAVSGQSGFLSLKKKDNPDGIYAKTKKKNEKELIKIAKKNKLELIIIRPPMVYGDEAKGNYEKLVKLIKYNMPFPFKNIKNKKQFISIYNLIDFIYECIMLKKINIQKFLVADEDIISTEKFINLIAKKLGKTPIMFYVNVNILIFFAKILNKKNELDKLTSNLEVDVSKAKKILNWRPPYTIFESFEKMNEWKD